MINSHHIETPKSHQDKVLHGIFLSICQHSVPYSLRFANSRHAKMRPGRETPSTFFPPAKKPQLVSPLILHRVWWGVYYNKRLTTRLEKKTIELKFLFDPARDAQPSGVFPLPRQPYKNNLSVSPWEQSWLSSIGWDRLAEFDLL